MDLEIPSSAATRSWAATEFASLDCKDVWWKRRFERVASDFPSQPGVSIPNACGNWAGMKIPDPKKAAPKTPVFRLKGVEFTVAEIASIVQVEGA